MAEEQKEGTFGVKPYQFGEGTTSGPRPHTTTQEDDPTGVEDVSYDKVTTQGAPSNPRNAGEVVERGVAASGGKGSSGESGIDLSGIDNRIKWLKDTIAMLEPMETEEQRKKRERREKSAKIVSAISDGLSAMGNLFFTTQYAPNMYNHEGSHVAAQDAAIEKARKVRDANRDAHLKFALALGEAEAARAKAAREAELAQERKKLAKEKAQREQDERDWLLTLRPDKENEQKSKSARAQYMAQEAQARAEKAEELAQAEVDAKRAQAKRYNSLAAGGKSNGGGSGEQPYAYDRDGKIHYFKKEETAEKFARAQGTWVEEEYDEVTDTHTEDELNGKKDVKQVKKKKRGYSQKPQSKKGAGYGDSGKGAGYGD